MEMDKKICIITGANSGIGKQAAIQISSKGYHVVIGFRNRGRGEAALKEILEKSGGSAELMIVDMSLKASILAFAEQVVKEYDTIDVLIHNAAVFDISQKQRKTTSEGYETVWMTNHAGPVYLTRLLLPALKKSEDGRILTVSSKGLLAMPGLKVDISDPEFKNRKFSMTKAYYQAKRAQVMYTYWLADNLKGTSVTANSIRVTAVKIDISRYPEISAFTKWIYKQKSKKSISTERMAETYTYLATSPDVRGISGKYFDENDKQVKSNSYTYEKQNIEAVMDLTESYLN